MDFKCSEPWAVISVVSDGSHPKLSADNRVGLLRLAFWDVDDVIPYRPRMTEDQSIEVWKFIDEVWDKISTLVVHCEGGISRSSAIAAAISKIKLGHEGGFFRTHIPNRYVYSTLLRVNENRKKQ
ncbi:hypothetical protein C4577_01935 [Candidatus Parcubacteria bacterium]|nr:MAG: hypothetical protein C4577_01935 [Candidatus Parcubacteria bacterium]